jgi:hypothetical protein
MNLTTILLVALSNGGYWLSGQTETVEIRWATEQPVAGVTLAWRLTAGEASLASGRLSLSADRQPTTFRLTVPRVRTRTAMKLAWRAEQAGRNKPIAEGIAAIEAYPDDLLAGLSKRLTAKHVFVWDQPESLPALLKKAKIEYTQVSDEKGLSFISPDILIVGKGRLGTEAADQQKILGLASSGVNVLVLNQTRPSTLAGYALTRRTPPAKLAWREEHPLTASLRRFGDQQGLGDCWPIRLPADEPALEIAFWPREVAGTAPAPIDALVVNKSVGRGRLVLCQIPLGSWQSDPRSQLFLVDALDYLASPVVPTPPPSRRPQPPKPAATPRESNLVLP